MNIILFSYKFEMDVPGKYYIKYIKYYWEYFKCVIVKIKVWSK